jgi:iron(III) transport system substrate-binding protein
LNEGKQASDPRHAGSTRSLSGLRILGAFGICSILLGGAARPTLAASPVLTLYNGQHPATTDALVSAFEKSTGVQVKVRSDDEGLLANQIVTEGSRSPADVFYTENAPPQQLLGEQHLLAPLGKATLAKVKQAYNSTDGTWVGVSARAAVLVYNTKKISASQLPHSVLDLAKPQWKGKIGVAPSETDFQPLVTAVDDLKGQAATLTWLKGLKTNSTIYDDNEGLVAAVNRGDIAVGIIEHYYWYRLRDQVGASKLQSQLYYFGHHDPGALVTVSGASVLASSHNKALAQKFVSFLVSKAGEEIIANSESYEYPLGSGVQTAKPLKPFSQLDPPVLPLKDLGDGRLAIQLLQQVGLL